MFYGGAGKTTLAIDLACHLAAGDPWLVFPVRRPARALLVENEGPRPLYRRKLRRKLAGWTGSPLEGRVYAMEAPWARLSFADPDALQRLAATVRELEIDVVIVGPVTRSGMNEAGTLQEVRDFMHLVGKARELAGRPVTVVLIHHENKGGKVSGAWEGAGDTLFHVRAQGHGQTRLYVQKARWASAHHATTLHLTWTDGRASRSTSAKSSMRTRWPSRSSLRSPRTPAPGGSGSRMRLRESGVTVVEPSAIRCSPAGSSRTSRRSTASRRGSTTAPSGGRRAFSWPTIRPSSVCARSGAQTGRRAAPAAGALVDPHLRPAPRLKAGAGGAQLQTGHPERFDFEDGAA